MLSNLIHLDNSAGRLSWSTGFARTVGDAANPGLRSALRGLWYPSLGATGDSIHGAVGGVNIACTSDASWANTANGYAIEQNGTTSCTVTPPLDSFVSTTVSWEIIFESFDDTSSSSAPFRYAQGGTDIAHMIFGSPSRNFQGVLRIDGSEQLITSGSRTTFAGVRYHYVMTYDGVDLKLWRDAVLLTTVNNAGAHTGGVSGAVLNLGQNYEGLIYKLANYNRALTASEIQQLYVDPSAAIRRTDKTYLFGGGAPPTGNRRRRVLIGAA